MDKCPVCGSTLDKQGQYEPDGTITVDVHCPDCLADEVENRELCSNPRFIAAMTKIVRGLENSILNLQQVKRRRP